MSLAVCCCVRCWFPGAIRSAGALAASNPRPGFLLLRRVNRISSISPCLLFTTVSAPGSPLVCRLCYLESLELQKIRIASQHGGLCLGFCKIFCESCYQLEIDPKCPWAQFRIWVWWPSLVAAPDVCRICNKSFFCSLQHLGMMMVRARCLQDLRRIPLLLHRRRRRRPNPQPMGDPSGPMMGRPSHHNSTVPTPVGRLFNQTSCKMFDRFSNVENLHWQNGSSWKEISRYRCFSQSGCIKHRESW